MERSSWHVGCTGDIKGDKSFLEGTAPVGQTWVLFPLWRVEKQPMKIWEITDKSREIGTIVWVSPLQIVIKSVYYKYWVYHAR